MSEPVKEIRKYFGAANIEHLIDENAMSNAERFLNEPLELSIVVSRCSCGWFDYFSSSTCPACGLSIVIRNNTDMDEIIYPVATTN